ncbi:hypothetical protein ACWEQV_22890 [Rhodococcus aetherivorans]
MVRKLISVLVSVAASVLVTVSLASPVGADQPPPGYNTAEVLWTAATPLGDVPLRRGFYDPDKQNPYSNKTGEDAMGVGFGMDKVWHKHGITNSSLIKYVMQTGTARFRLPDYPTVGNFTRHVEFLLCIPTSAGPICQEEPEHQPSYDILVAAEFDEYELYHEWPAGDPVGVLTAFCVGHTGLCPSNVNNPIIDDLIDGMVA